MNLLMIATIHRGRSIIGFRIFDTKDKDGKFMDVPLDNVKQVINSGAAEIVNLGVIKGEVVGTNGVLERYPKITPTGRLIGNMSPLVVINQLGDAGYTVVDYKGKVKKATTKDVVEYAKKHGISNGKVVAKDNIEFISSIVGSYDVEEIKTGRVDNAAAAMFLKVSGNKDRSTTAKNVEADVDFEIDESDVFEVFTEEQKEVIKNYYIWYTVDRYKALAKNIRLTISTTKAEALAELRGIQEWEFAGIWDTGFRGGGKCALGHELRYVYYAVPSDERGNTDAFLPFGSRCSADFFRIDPKDMRILINTANMMSEEIKNMSVAIVTGQIKAEMQKAELLYAMIRKLGSGENVVNTFGKKVGETLLRFIVARLPFPQSLVIEASKQASKDIIAFYNSLFPEYSDTVVKIMTEYRSAGTLIKGAREYLEFVATNKIEGYYSYDPLDDTVKRRDIGGYNKTTRSERRRLLRSLRTKIASTKFDYDELESVLYVLDRGIKYKDKTVEKFKGTDLEKRTGVMMDKILQYVEVPGLTPTERNERLSIFNSLLTSGDHSFYRFRPTYFNADINGVSSHKHISYLKQDLEKVEGRFDIILDDFYNYIIDKEKKERQAALEEETRLEKERLERERLKAEKEEQERIRIEQEKKDEERARQEELLNDRTAQLRGLIDAHPDLPTDYGIETAKAILESGKLFKEFTPRQKWRINNTIRIYEDWASGNKEALEKLNRNYDLDEHPDIKDKVQRIIEKADDVEMQEVLKVTPNVIKICYTITRNNRASDRQMKHVNKAIEILDQA